MVEPAERWSIRPVTRDLLERRLDEFQALDRSPLSWDRERLLSERPGKWEYSLAAFDGQQLAGVLFASLRSPHRPHIHLLLVGEAYRSKGLGKVLIDTHRKQSPWPVTTLKVGRDNEDAIRFYRRNGFRILTRKGDYLWLATGSE